MNQDLRQVLDSEAVFVAQRLLGCELIRELDGKKVRLRIVETEAYDQTDAASHSFRGRTPRTDSMFGPAGRSYVYFTYGMHYCCNVVTGPVGEGAAVLLRAVEPLTNIAVLQRYRDISGPALTNGPAKLCQALAIDRQFNGHNLVQPPLKLKLQPATSASLIMTTKRIGIRKDVDRPWRFYLKNNQYVSKVN